MRACMVVLSICSAGLVSAATDHQKILRKSFQTWADHHHKVYSSNNDKELRFQIWTANHGTLFSWIKWLLTCQSLVRRKMIESFQTSSNA